MEGHIADIFKTRGPKLTQIKLGVTVNNVGDRVMLPEKWVISEKKTSPCYSLSPITLFAIKMIGSK